MSHKSIKNLLAYFLLFSMTAHAQNGVNIVQFPKSMQVIPRNLNTNVGTYLITGNLHRSSDITHLRLNVQRGDSMIFEKMITVSYTHDSFLFQIPVEIKAELINYQVFLHGKKNATYFVLRQAEKVVAGDIIVVNGQSNCIGSIDPEDEHPFLRSYTAQFGWNRIEYTQPGKWPPHLARNIIEGQKVPVALFNEAIGGVTQSVFLKTYSGGLSNNYFDLMRRLEGAEVRNKVHAFIWWQGESDGWETSTADYKKQFKELYTDWKRDYNLSHVFMFQIRFRSCTHTKPNIMEAQRQLSEEINDLDIMSVNNAQSDGCHFAYHNGYDSLGKRMYRLIAARIYKQSISNKTAPNIDKIWFSGRNEITILMKKMVGKLKIIGEPWNDFVCQDGNIQVTGCSVAGNQLKITFSGDSIGVKTVSYLSHVTAANDWIVNELGVGILSFHQVPISREKPILPFKDSINYSISPTYGSDIFIINQPDVERKRNVCVYNALGILVFEQDWQNGDASETQFNANNWQKGMYFVCLEVENRRKRVFKILKTE
jgi:Carbohydrate esterase, sialic acid-specific acetylesterase/Secretion system C-terminal sorting domain